MWKIINPKYNTSIWMEYKKSGAFILVGFGFLYFTHYSYKKSNSTSFKVGIAGAIATVSSQMLFHFMDTINVRAKSYIKPISCRDMTKLIYQTEGVNGYFRGVIPNFYSSLFGGFIYFYFYKLIKEILAENLLKLNTFDSLRNFVASSISEAICLILTYPLELIKTRIQIGYKGQTNLSLFQFLCSIKPFTYRNFVSNTYVGSAPFMITFIAFTAIQFTIYEALNKYFLEIKLDQNFNPTGALILNTLISVSVASLFTNFLEVLTINSQSKNKKSLLLTLKTEGLKFFFRGLGVKTLNVIPSSILMFVLLNKYCKSYNVKFTDF